MNMEEFVQFLISAENMEELKWGSVVRESQKFNFGEYDTLPKLDKPEKVWPYIENCPQAFNLPFQNCLFFTSGGLFLHAIVSTDEPSMIETRFAVYMPKEDAISFSPIVGFIDFVGGRLAAAPFLEAAKRPKQKELEELSFHYCFLASCLAILNSENVATIDHLPESRTLNYDNTKPDRRLYVYKTLHITPRQVNNHDSTFAHGQNV